MKKYLAYITVCAAIFAVGCTDFGEENQLTLPDAPLVAISNVVAEEAGNSITFTVAPAGTAGYYSWVVVESELTDSTISADRVLKLLEAGKANGLINYADKQSATITVENLTPFTVYQIYAVAASPDGVVSAVQNTHIRTLDDGSKPTPEAVAVADTTVTLTFHEPLRLGSGKVFVSYFAKNTLSGANPLVVAPGYEDYNPQNIVIQASALSINGNALVIKLPAAPAGAYASITYEAGAVTDLQGNLSSAFTAKADTLVNGAPARGITVHLANKTWALHSEFEELNPDTVATFAEWEDLIIPAYPDEGIAVAKKVATIVPTVIYHEPGKTTIVEVTSWGRVSGIPAFLLPEEPARGATVDLVVPAGAYEDVYGNTSKALTVEGNYLYSYGYTLADIVGTYDIAVTSYWDGPLTEAGIVIEKAADSDTLLVKNLLDTGTEIKAVFDPVAGLLILDDEQLLLADVNFGASGTGDIYFVNADASAPVVFKVPVAGTITSPAQMWGYYIDPLGWYDVYTESVWTRTSTDTSAAPASLRASKVIQTKIHTLKDSRKFSL
ncbi:MAG: hypothetical protein LBO74_10785 [Candidatus Symbiothrix sp.]|jgi:hypothetical protein|nr:hypothetical protein [Candidatus Symbiothrix sp.]